MVPDGKIDTKDIYLTTRYLGLTSFCKKLTTGGRYPKNEAIDFQFQVQGAQGVMYDGSFTMVDYDRTFHGKWYINEVQVIDGMLIDTRTGILAVKFVLDAPPTTEWNFIIVNVATNETTLIQGISEQEHTEYLTLRGEHELVFQAMSNLPILQNKILVSIVVFLASILISSKICVVCLNFSCGLRFLSYRIIFES